MRKTLSYVNEYAFRAGPSMYICCLLLYLMSAVNSFVILGYSEYNVNAAYYLIKGEAGLTDVISKIIWYLAAIVFFQILTWFQNLVETRLILSVSLRYERELNEQLSSIRWDYFEMHDVFLMIQESRTKSREVLVKMLQKSMLLFSIFPMLVVYGYYLSRIHMIIVILFLAILLVFNRLGTKLQGDSVHLWEEIRPYAQRQRYYFNLCGDKVTHQEYRFNRLLGYVMDKWEEAYDAEISLRMKIHKSVEFRIKAAQLLFYLPRFLVLIYITIGIINGRYEIGFFVMINSMLVNLTNNLTAIQEIREVFRTEKSFLDAFHEVMRLEKQKEVEKQERAKASDDIVMNQVIYRYPQANYKALNGLNLHLEKGEKIAIVGPNGSGKTTAMNLILSLTKPNSGYVNTHTIKQISVIIQDFTQYQASIKENILFGSPLQTFSDEDIWGLLEIVGLKEKIQNLPEGIYTKLGQLEKGVELSKGQWQRLAIARLLANPKAELWILDEPTAYLDPISEIEIYDLIYRLAGERTVLFISHRLGFARKADRILVFDKGRIAENGMHEELIEKNGIYAEMYRLQEEWYIT